jgi:hypothetical protein
LLTIRLLLRLTISLLLVLRLLVLLLHRRIALAPTTCPSAAHRHHLGGHGVRT